MARVVASMRSSSSKSFTGLVKDAERVSENSNGSMLLRLVDTADRIHGPAASDEGLPVTAALEQHVAVRNKRSREFSF